MRNAAQREKFLSKDFAGVTIDPILHKLLNPERYPGFSDPRHCLVFWARPPLAVKAMIADLQQQLLSVAPSECYLDVAIWQTLITVDLWLMPIERLHMTALEIAFSLTAPEIEEIVKRMSTKIPEITDYPYHHRARLIKPKLSYDTAAIALSFEPAAGEMPPDGRSPREDDYTYHHLRRDLYQMAKATGVEVASRYVVPSAHLTIARFVSQADTSVAEGNQPNAAKVQNLLDQIDKINRNLSQQSWPKEGTAIREGGQWVVGQVKGLDCRKGVLWYGGGETIRLGKGF